MSFGFPPKGWALCDGQLLPINQNQALFSLLGTTFGGDGRVNFGLPNLQGRTPIISAAAIPSGERGGEQAHTLSISRYRRTFIREGFVRPTPIQPAPATTYSPRLIHTVLRGLGQPT